MMARGSKDSEKPKNRIGKKIARENFGLKTARGSPDSFFSETYAGKETRIRIQIDLKNKPNMRRTRIGGGYMVVVYGYVFRAVADKQKWQMGDDDGAAAA